MKNLVTKAQYRKILKNAGFKVSFKTIGFSDLLRKSSEIQVIKDLNNKEMPSIFTEESLKYWKKAVEIKNSHEIIS